MLSVALLGPLTLRVDGAPVDVPGRQRRVLLAVLALADGRTVGVDRLVDALWEDDPPENADQALYNHVSRLRGHLRPYGDRLERVAAATASDSNRTSSTSTPLAGCADSEPNAALALWRGPALAGVPIGPGTRARVRRPRRAPAAAGRRPARGADRRRRPGRDRGRTRGRCRLAASRADHPPARPRAGGGWSGRGGHGRGRGVPPPARRRVRARPGSGARRPWSSRSRPVRSADGGSQRSSLARTAR